MNLDTLCYDLYARDAENYCDSMGDRAFQPAETECDCCAGVTTDESGQVVCQECGAPV